MIHVYFETIGHGPVYPVATFETEEAYNACVPALEQLAQREGLQVTEAVKEEAPTYQALLESLEIAYKELINMGVELAFVDKIGSIVNRGMA